MIVSEYLQVTNQLLKISNLKNKRNIVLCSSNFFLSGTLIFSQELLFFLNNDIKRSFLFSMVTEISFFVR